MNQELELDNATIPDCQYFSALNCNNGDKWIACQRPDATGINPSKAMRTSDIKTAHFILCSGCEHYKEG